MPARAVRWLPTLAPDVLGQNETVYLSFRRLEFVEILFIGALKNGTNEAGNSVFCQLWPYQKAAVDRSVRVRVVRKEMWGLVEIFPQNL